MSIIKRVKKTTYQLTNKNSPFSTMTVELKNVTDIYTNVQLLLQTKGQIIWYLLPFSRGNLEIIITKILEKCWDICNLL